MYEFDFTKMNMQEMASLESFFQTFKTLQDIKQNFTLFILNIKKFSKTDLRQVPYYHFETFIKDAKDAFYQEIDPVGHIANQEFDKDKE